jgi:outer membrane protein assembly factor BamB
MIKKVFYIAVAAILITSCSGKRKIKSITEFTEKLVSSSTHSVSLSDPVSLADFHNQITFTKNKAITIKVDNISKFSFSKLGVFEKFITSPSIVEGNIYSLSTNGRVSSFNLTNNKYNWSVNLPVQTTNITTGTITHYLGKIFVTADLQLFVLDSSNGKEITRKSLDDISKNYPVILGNAFLIQTVNNNLYAYETDSWKQVWAYETWPEYISSSTVLAPVIFQDSVISGFTTGQLVANKISDGSELWQINLSKESDQLLGYNPLDLSCQPVVEDRFMYVASNNGHLIKLDLLNASIIWKKKIQDVTSMSVSGTAIFLTNNARQIAAVSIFDGSIIWTNDLTDPKLLTSKKPIKPSLFTSPLVTTEGIFVASSHGEAFLLDPLNGSLKNNFNAPNKIKYFGLYNGKIIVFTDNNAYMLN